MKKTSGAKAKKSVFAALPALLAVLIMVLSIPVNQADAAPSLSEDTEEISVLSVTVNVNTETEQVFTELILNNESGEDKEVTFSLPEMGAGREETTDKTSQESIKESSAHLKPTPTFGPTPTLLEKMGGFEKVSILIVTVFGVVVFVIVAGIVILAEKNRNKSE